MFFQVLKWKWSGFLDSLTKVQRGLPPPKKKIAGSNKNTVVPMGAANYVQAGGVPVSAPRSSQNVMPDTNLLCLVRPHPNDLGRTGQALVVQVSTTSPLLILTAVV